MAGIRIRDPWARVQTVESREAGGFMIVTNTGPEHDRLVGALSPVAEKVELHGIKVVGSEIRIRPIKRGIMLAVDVPVELKPRGYHLLLQGLKAPLAAGQKVPVTLTFARARPLDVELVVRQQGPVGADVLNAAEG